MDSATRGSDRAQHIPEFGFTSEPEHTQAYLWPVVQRLAGDLAPGTRVLDIGCGNGSMAKLFVERGCTVVGVDPSAQGIAHARQRGLPNTRFEQSLATAALIDELGEAPFDIVVSTEVVEHLYAPRDWAACSFRALRPGGSLICSTPYHGYFKNVALAVTGKLDNHFTVLWDGGHIKFWSPRTLAKLLTEAGFANTTWQGAGRFAPMWMSMVMRGQRPNTQ